MQALEKMLDDMFKSLPAIPEAGRKGLVQFMPWLTLLGGIVSLVAAWYLYQAVAIVNQFANSLNAAYGVYGYTAPATGFSLFGWLSLAVLVLQGVLFFMAFPALRANKKSGWNLLLWAALVSVVYDIFANVFAYMNPGQLIASLLGSAIGLYLLFQIRPFYSGAGVAMPAAKSAEKEAHKADKK